MDETRSLMRVPTEGCLVWSAAAAGSSRTPRLSPDGAKGLAFGQGRLCILDLQDLGASRSIPLDRDGSLGAWSPDGSEAAWSHLTTDGDVSHWTGIISISDLVSGRSRVLTELTGRYIRHITWSPDGSQLLVIAGDDGPAVGRVPRSTQSGLQPTSLYLVDIGDAESRMISSGHYVAAAWSPDGTRIAAIDYSGDRQVVVLNADGSGDRRVLAELPGGGVDTYLLAGVVWHPGPAR